MKKKRLSFTLFLIVLFLTVWFSVGKTRQYYFYADDYASLYNIQSHYPHPPPYQVYDFFFTPIYKLFGLQAKAYFLSGILTFFLASLAVCFFIKVLTKNNLIAILSSLIFATGYIGLDQFTMLIVSSIGNLNIINVSLTLILFVLWLDTRKIRYYLATIVVFWYSLATIPFRAFPLVLFLPTAETVLTFKPETLRKTVKKFVLMAIRLTPFLFIAYHFGIFSYGAEASTLKVVTQFSNRKIFALLTPASINELFAILGRIVLIRPLAKFFGFFPLEAPYSRAGLIFFLGIVFISLFFSRVKKYSRLGRSLLIVLFLTVEGYLGNMILLPSFDANGAVNRYLTIAFLGYSAIFPIFFYLLMGKLACLTRKKGLRFFVPTLVLPLIISMTLLSREYEQEIIQERSQPARLFFQQLKNYLPSISGKNIFYFDRADYYPVASRFGNILLGAHRPKEVTLAFSYQVPQDSIKIIEDPDALMDVLKNKEVDLHHIHAFYYDEKGLHWTTDKVWSFLEKGDRKEIPADQVAYGIEMINPQAEISLSDISSLTPMVINLNLKLTPLSSTFFNFPFDKKEKPDKSLIFDYLLSRKRYYDNVQFEVSSSHPIYRGEFLIDDKMETWWIAESGPWQVDPKTWIKIDLGETRRISRLIWYQLESRMPSDYQISVSVDGLSWEDVDSVFTYEPLPGGRMVNEDFAPVKARFINFRINKTITTWPPGISEIEVIEDEYKNVDLALALKIKQNPFEYVQNEQEVKETYDYLKKGGLLIIKTLTNKDAIISNNYSLRIPISLGGQYHQYQVPLSARGTNLKKICLELNFPARMEVGKIEIIHPSLKELSQ